MVATLFFPESCLLSPQVSNHINDLLPAVYPRGTLNWHQMFTRDTSEPKGGSVALFLPALSFLIWEMGVNGGYSITRKNSAKADAQTGNSLT